MTLDFKKLIRNSVKKQMAVQHFECNVQIFGREEMDACEKVKAKLQDTLGENGMLDADYWLFFSGAAFTRDVIEKTLFKIVNSALGNSANSLTESDLKTFSFGDDRAAPAVPGSDFASADLGASEADEANGKAISDAMGSSEVDESVETPEKGEQFVFLKITMK